MGLSFLQVFFYYFSIRKTEIICFVDILLLYIDELFYSIFDALPMKGNKNGSFLEYIF